MRAIDCGTVPDVGTNVCEAAEHTGHLDLGRWVVENTVGVPHRRLDDGDGVFDVRAVIDHDVEERAAAAERGVVLDRVV